MFDIGFSELMIIALVALIVLGPKRLPEVARTAGQWMGRLRRFIADVKQDIDREMQQAELAELRNLKHELDETRRVMEETSSKLLQEANIETSAESFGAAPAAPIPAADPPRPGAAAEMPPPDKKRAGKRKKASTPKRAHE